MLIIIVAWIIRKVYKADPVKLILAFKKLENLAKLHMYSIHQIMPSLLYFECLQNLYYLPLFHKCFLKVRFQLPPIFHEPVIVHSNEFFLQATFDF